VKIAKWHCLIFRFIQYVVTTDYICFLIFSFCKNTCFCVANMCIEVEIIDVKNNQDFESFIISECRLT
jgi:hypothetical protein